MHKLVISDDEGKTTVVPLVRDEITIGRKDGNTIRLTERNVSRRHARLTKRNGAFVIEDLGSYNGVKINGRRIESDAPLNAGDQIAIGDYIIAIQSEAAQADDDTLAATAVDAGPPARLVMLTPPTPGAEFGLRDGMRIGRAEDLDIWVNHRSISREHAAVHVDGETIRVEDLGSANGLRLNGEDVKDGVLGSGDVLELGQVRFRFVAAGDHYVFEADRTVQMDAVVAPEEPPSRTPLFAAIAIVLIAIVAGAAIALSGGDETPEGGVAIEPIDGRGGETAMTGTNEGPDDQVQAHVDRCREHLGEGDRENLRRAISAAVNGLDLAENDADLQACKAEAEREMEILEHFENALAHHEAGEREEAWFSLEEVPETHALRTSEEAESICAAYAHDVLERARGGEASYAGIAIETGCLTPAEEREARGIARRGGSGGSGRPVAVRTPMTTMQRQPMVTPMMDVTPPPSMEVAMETSGGAPTSIADVYRECGHSDHACLVRELPRLPASSRRDALIIESYRVMRNAPRVRALQQQFVNRYPTTSQATRYRRELEAN